MSLLSENIGVESANQQAAAGFPARLVHTQLPQREVARLEFVAVGSGKEDVNDAASAVEAQTEPSLNDEASAHATTISQEVVDALIEAAVSKERSESREEWEMEVVARVAAERSAVMQVCEKFSAERAHYFECVESEVVKLALAIATRILHRDARMDPLLLAAAARVALEKIADGSKVTLRVPDADESAWREAFRKDMESGVELTGDGSLASGECVLETSVGKVDLGVSAQLAEIEQGFFDLLQQRPA